MQNFPWIKSYPQGVRWDDALNLTSVQTLLDNAVQQWPDQPAIDFMGKKLSYRELSALVDRAAAGFQALGVKPGVHVGLYLPNTPHYVISFFGILKAGGTVVNYSPLDAEKVLEHKVDDSETDILVTLSLASLYPNMKGLLGKTRLQHLVVGTLGEFSAMPAAVDAKMAADGQSVAVAFDAQQHSFEQLLANDGQHQVWPVADVTKTLAVLQYTGGTTGVSKGAVLLHRNLVANVIQSEAWYQPALKKVPAGEQIVTICALPLYHIFGFNSNMMLGMRMGGCNILIPNPRDMPAVLKELSKHKFHSFPAVNTLFNGLANHPDFGSVNWSNLKVSVGGGMAVQSAVAKLWLEKTGCPICEGYGLSETSPIASCNPVTATEFTGSIGVPLSSTYFKLLDDEGQTVTALGQPGEIAIKGPQVMAGYWQRPDETAKVMTEDGYFKTGDIGTMDERGFFKIVDRKKDMVLVSGFNVYPNEIEEVVAQCPGVMECAAVGVADSKTGEAVKLVIVKKSPDLTEDEVRAFCKIHLTGYKQPKTIEFRTELPKTPVGKILRRELRDKK